MAKSNSSTRKTTRITKKAYQELQEKCENLQAENKRLRKQVKSLTETNRSQLDRLVGEELLRIHVRELKEKIALIEKKEP